MEDLAFDHTPSTVLEPEAPTHAVGGGAPKIDAEPSLRDIIANEVKEEGKAPKDAEPAPQEDKAKEPEAKPDKDAKPAEKQEQKPEEKAEKARSPDGKFAKPEAEPAEEPKPEAKADEAKHEGRRIDPPARFLPDAKEKWTNVPRPVQRDIEVAFREHEAEVTRYREAAERYEGIHQLDQLAEQSGTTLKAALSNYVSMEQALRTDPVTGFKALLSNMGIQPQEAVSHILGAFNISPQALAQHIANDPSLYVSRPAAQPQAPAQRQPDPEVIQLKQQLAAMQEQQLVASVIEPFKQSHPRYAELEPDIAFFLDSGRISQNLSPHERLEVAYDMAARMNPASHVEDRASPSQDGPDPARRADNDFSGSKSIKSAPGSVSPDMEPERGGSIRDLLQDELKRQKRA